MKMKKTSMSVVVGGAFILASGGVLAQGVPAGVPAGAQACAHDGGTCQVNGNWTGVYGVQGKFAQISGSGPFTCLPSNFPPKGSLPNLKVPDPAPNIGKTCWVVAQGATPAQTVTPTKPATPAAGQQTTTTVGKITFVDSPSPAALLSDGQNRATAEYWFKATGPDGTTPFVGSLPVTALYVRGDGTLKCPKVTANASAKYGAGIKLVYQATGFSDVQWNNNEVLSATTQFALAFNNDGGEVCTGSFKYVRDNAKQVTAEFQLLVGEVNQATAPIKVSFQAPKEVAPSLVDTKDGALIRKGLFESAILNSQKQAAFKYGLMYLNRYGLLAPGSTITCTLGNAKAITLTTDANSRVPLSGMLKVSARPRAVGDTSSLAYDATTSLTGETSAFTLARGQNIGAVKCTSSDAKPATFTQDLGNW